MEKEKFAKALKKTPRPPRKNRENGRRLDAGHSRWAEPLASYLVFSFLDCGPSSKEVVLNTRCISITPSSWRAGAVTVGMLWRKGIHAASGPRVNRPNSRRS